MELRGMKEMNVPVVVQRFCNVCGEAIVADVDETQDKQDYLHIEKQWGYFSNGKDCITHKADICEDCWDRIRAQFVIPPTV